MKLPPDEREDDAEGSDGADLAAPLDVDDGAMRRPFKPEVAPSPLLWTTPVLLTLMEPDLEDAVFRQSSML